jgi:hypothetical protein
VSLVSRLYIIWIVKISFGSGPPRTLKWICRNTDILKQRDNYVSLTVRHCFYSTRNSHIVSHSA